MISKVKVEGRETTLEEDWGINITYKELKKATSFKIPITLLTVTIMQVFALLGLIFFKNSCVSYVYGYHYKLLIMANIFLIILYIFSKRTCKPPTSKLLNICVILTTSFTLITCAVYWVEESANEFVLDK